MHTSGGRKGRDVHSGGKHGTVGKTGAGRTQRMLEMGSTEFHQGQGGSPRDSLGWGISSWCLQEPAVGSRGGQPLSEAQQQATGSPHPLFRLTHSRGDQGGVSHWGFDKPLPRGSPVKSWKTRVGFQSSASSLFHVLAVLVWTNNGDHRTSLFCLIMGFVKMSTKSNDKSTVT